MIKIPKARCFFCDQRMQNDKSNYHSCSLKCLNDKCIFKPTKIYYYNINNYYSLCFSIGKFGLSIENHGKDMIAIYSVIDPTYYDVNHLLLFIENKFSKKELLSFTEEHIKNLLILK